MDAYILKSKFVISSEYNEEGSTLLIKCRERFPGDLYLVYELIISRLESNNIVTLIFCIQLLLVAFDNNYYRDNSLNSATIMSAYPASIVGAIDHSLIMIGVVMTIGIHLPDFNHFLSVFPRFFLTITVYKYPYIFFFFFYTKGVAFGSPFTMCFDKFGPFLILKSGTDVLIRNQNFEKSCEMVYKVYKPL